MSEPSIRQILSARNASRNMASAAWMMLVDVSASWVFETNAIRISYSTSANIARLKMVPVTSRSIYAR